MIFHHSLTATSACKISGEMFFNKGINITFKWCINNFFIQTFFCSFSSDFFPCQLDFFFSLSLSILGLESFGNFHLVSEFLVVSYSLTAGCECWLPCVKLGLHYENTDNIYIKENMEITWEWVMGNCRNCRNIHFVAFYRYFLIFLTPGHLY